MTDQLQPPQSSEAATPGRAFIHAPALCGAGPIEIEAHRMACEVRYVVKKPESWRKSYLAGVEEKRGKKAADELRNAVFEELRKK